LVPQNIKIKIYRTVILLDVLYGCETWSLTLTEEHRLMVLDNRVSEKDIWAYENNGNIWEMRDSYRNLVGKPEEPT
jgi:hypothetical protein